MVLRWDNVKDTRLWSSWALPRPVMHLQTPACIQPLVLCRIPKDLVLGSGPRVGTFL